MEDLFKTKLSVNNSEVSYHVAFDREKYIFTAQGSQAPQFVLRREHDEWHQEGELPEGLKEKAVDALEKYLLKQH